MSSTNRLSTRELAGLALPVLGIVFALACGEAGPGTPAELAVVAGDAATAVVGTALAESLAVRVLDQNGRGVPGVTVAWTIVDGGGSVSPAGTVTGESGEARAMWRLGRAAGTQSASATVADLQAATFTATATAGAAVALVKARGDGQSATVATSVANSLVARARDEFDNPVTGVPVTWTVTSGGGSLSASSSVTGAEGEAEVSLTLGPGAGSQSVSATSPGLTGTTFGVVGTPGAAASLEKTLGDNQSWGISSETPDSLVVRVLDQYGNPVPSVTVMWAPGPGDGSVSPATTTTRPNGEARTQWTLGPQVETQSVTATVTSLPPVSFEAAAVPFNLIIGGLYITQSVQTLTRSVPLIAGRPGYLRVWVKGNGTNNAAPNVRIRWYQSGSLVQTDILPAPGAQVDPVVAESPLTRSWNLPVPGSLIQPGLELVAEADPDGQVVEGDEGDNTFPATGRLAFDVRGASALNVTFVPVRQTTSGLTGNVTAGNKDNFLALTRKIWPLETVSSSVHATFATGNVLESGGNGWSATLSQIDALRVSEGSSNHYVGVVKVSYTSGVAGIGYVPGRSTITWDYLPSGDEVTAHELGHNFSRFHSPCGNPGGVDPNYPYSGGVIGVHGMDVGAGTLMLPSRTDIMGYCSNVWISDYTYVAALNYRAANPGPPPGTGARQAALLVWGRMDGDQLILEPAFPLTTVAAVPIEPGPFRLDGLDATGGTLFSYSFQGTEVADLPGRRTFAFAIPAATARMDRLAALRLSRGAQATEMRPTAQAAAAAPAEVALLAEPGDAARLEWNAAVYPMALVRDARSGEVLSFARGGAVLLPTRAAELDVTLSDGVRGVSRRVTVTR